MAGISFLSRNLLDDANISITTGSANAQFPLSNLKNPSPSKKFRSTGNTVVLVLDLLQTREIDMFSIFGDTTGVFGVTACSIKTSVTNDFSLATPVSVPLYPEQNMGYVFNTLVSHRYVEVTLTGTGAFCEVGAIFLGKRVDLEQNNLSIASFKYEYDDLSDISRNRYGQKFIDDLPLVKSIGGRLEYCNKTEQAQVDNIVLYNGRKRPLVMVVDQAGIAMEDSESKLTIYGYLTSMPSWTANGNFHYSTDIEIEGAV